MEETVLREQLRTVDESLLFLLLIVLSVLLSYWGVRIQREGLCRTLQGDAEGAAALPRVFPIRLSASALVVGALGFFLCLALKTERETARGGTPAARRSASLCRLRDLPLHQRPNFIARSGCTPQAKSRRSVRDRNTVLSRRSAGCPSMRMLSPWARKSRCPASVTSCGAVWISTPHSRAR